MKGEAEVSDDGLGGERQRWKKGMGSVPTLLTGTVKFEVRQVYKSTTFSHWAFNAASRGLNISERGF